MHRIATLSAGEIGKRVTDLRHRRAPCKTGYRRDRACAAPPHVPPHRLVPPRTWKRSDVQEVDGIRVVRLWTWQPGSGDPGFASRMAYYLSFPVHAALWLLFTRIRFDAIMTSAPPLFTGIPGGYVLKRTSRVKWILDIRDLWIDASIGLGFLREGSLYERLSRRFEQACLDQADLVGVTTEELGRRISLRYRVTAPMELLPNGVNTEFFRPTDGGKKRQIIYAATSGTPRISTRWLSPSSR